MIEKIKYHKISLFVYSRKSGKEDKLLVDELYIKDALDSEKVIKLLNKVRKWNDEVIIDEITFIEYKNAIRSRLKYAWDTGDITIHK